ncbi:MinD/ParA family protein [Streptomyces sp. NPDC006012]|uniref:MinD/ParA family ATP-binding protein n=1 Tax=Streptomyces sp. NPDC006012 TaxID=3364739 RepID=UPI00368CE9B1
MSMFEDVTTARIGDLGRFVRGQGPAHCDVLASDERPEVTGHIAEQDFTQIHDLLTRYYKLVLIDTGNNMRAPNWLAAVRSADLLVVTTTVREDTSSAALWMLDALQNNVFDNAADLKSKTVTLLAEPTPHTDKELRENLKGIFSQRTDAVLQIPYDSALADGGVIDYTRLRPGTHTAWLYACAAMAVRL